MAINKVTRPQPAAPTIDDTDYNAQNTLIGINEIPERSKLDNWGQTATEPVIKQGTYIFMSGNTYAVETSDEAISGSPAPGINYIELTISGTVITAAWITDVSAYSFNPVQGGFYNGLKMVMPDICYLDGTDYNRGVSINNSLNNYVIADGSVSYGGGLNTRGTNISTEGGNLTLDGGTVDNLDCGDFLIDGTATEGSWSISTLPTIIPRGVYIVTSDSSLQAECYISGVWRNIAVVYIPIVISDGTNVRLKTTSGTITIYYRKL